MPRCSTGDGEVNRNGFNLSGRAIEGLNSLENNIRTAVSTFLSYDHDLSATLLQYPEKNSPFTLKGVTMELLLLAAGSGRTRGCAVYVPNVIRATNQGRRNQVLYYNAIHFSRYASGRDIDCPTV
nr:hypothetical protein CFP56_71266 [Quercus suber]